MSVHVNEKPIQFYCDRLPESCSICPFNYDTIGCNIIEEERDRELTAALNGDGLDANGKYIEHVYPRYSKCPLKLIKEYKGDNQK